jgi:CxxC motif-containing protein (DUF1111 family)
MLIGLTAFLRREKMKTSIQKNGVAWASCSSPSYNVNYFLCGSLRKIKPVLLARFLLLVWFVWLLSLNPASANQQVSNTLSGGETTVFDASDKAFSFPAGNTSLLRRDDFFMGKPFFKQPWVSAPASTKARDGLGALFSANSCQSCHVRNGRGRPPVADEDFVSLAVHLSIPLERTVDEQLMSENTGSMADPVYGHQLQSKAIPGVKPEGTPALSYESVAGVFADGEAFTLMKPSLAIEALQYGDLHADIQTSVRVAPALIGLGLLEAIPETVLLAHADPEDTDNDGISGKPSRVWDVKKQQMVVGRFGWKASQPTVVQQSAAAFSEDLGITSSYFPEPTCSEIQTDCLQALHGGKPEIPDNILQKVTYYTSMLAVPARRGVDDVSVQRGEALFQQAGCVSCHLPEITTGKSVAYPELSEQKIHPYTDLLLHDMGEGLADEHTAFNALGREWRTPPLWGIGLVEKVNKHTRFLHDGRAQNLMEAVLWHGGEAENAKQRVLKMTKEERNDLIAFLESL